MLSIDLNSFFSEEEKHNFRMEAKRYVGSSSDGIIENESEQVNQKIESLKKDAFDKFIKENE